MARFLFSTILLLATVLPAEPAVRNFFSPELDGTRLDVCLADAGTCGKPAADAFCKEQGFSEALLFQREAHLATRRLGSGEICEGADCIAFRQIKCFSPSAGAASAG